MPWLGYYGVLNIQPEWDQKVMKYYMAQGHLSWGITKKIDIFTGFIWTPFDGVRPTAAAMYTLAKPELLFIVNPRIDLHKETNAEMLMVLEYKPKITETLNLYTRFQGLYSHNVKHDYHGRSYTMLRAGLTYKDISFGVGDNIDFYGPDKIRENNYGLFMIMTLF